MSWLYSSLGEDSSYEMALLFYQDKNGVAFLSSSFLKLLDSSLLAQDHVVSENHSIFDEAVHPVVKQMREREA